jgi:hypothetical protein
LPKGVSIQDIRHALEGRVDASGTLLPPPSQLTVKLAQLPPAELGVLTAMLASSQSK